MTRPPRHFGDGDPFTPSRQWVEAWKPRAIDHWLSVLEDYRSRVAQHYQQQAELQPSAFSLNGPTELMLVASLTHSWIFARPSATDTAQVNEQWEHETLASNDIFDHPDAESLVRDELDLGTEWRLIGSEQLGGLWAATEQEAKAGGNPYKYYAPPPGSVEGHNLADLDEAFRSPKLDVDALLATRDRLRELEAFDDPQERGRQFDRLVEDVLRAHGCNVERGAFVTDDQVDVFVHRPFRAIVLCRWEHSPVGRPAIDELVAKLTRERPPIVAGMYVSMSGFTETAEVEVRRRLNERVVMLVDRAEFEQLINAEVHVNDLVDQKIDAIVRRY